MAVLEKRKNGGVKGTEKVTGPGTGTEAEPKNGNLTISSTVPEKAGDDGKGSGDVPDAGVIDFSQPAEQATEAEGGAEGEEVLAELTDAEAGDLPKVRAKLTEAHKDNARQRKLKQEALKSAETLKADVTRLNQELETARAEAAARSAQPAATTAGGTGYLAQFTKAEQVQAAKADALAVLKQVSANPDAESVVLPGNREWKLVNEKGESLAARAVEMAMEIVEGAEERVKQLEVRGAAERLVAERLPVLEKAVPDFKGRYEKLLKADWGSEGPKLSLHAAIGELVTSGEYTLVPKGKGKAAAKAVAPTTTPTVVKAKVEELPSTMPAMRPVEAGKPDVSALKARALGGDKEALKQWIKTGR